MARALFVVLATLLLWPAPLFAETTAEYRAALVETVEAAEAAQSALPPDVSLSQYPRLDQALVRLASIDQVTTSSGTTVMVTNRLLIQRFRGSRSEGVKAQDSLRQLAAALEASTGQADKATDSDARAALDEVLARPQFRGTTGSPFGRFLEDMRTRLFQWLESLFPGLAMPRLPGLDLSGPAAVIFWLIAGALAIFTIAFFAFVWRSARQNVANYVALPTGGINDGEDARRARLAAYRAADEGDYRRAIHFLYLWAILHLAEQSRLRYDRSLTNHEQLRALSDGGEVGELLRSAVETFDYIWYGHAACTATEYGKFRNTIERIVGAAT